MPERRDVCDVGVRRVYPHPRDVPRIAKPHVPPGVTAVRRAVHPVPVRDVAPDARLARTSVHHVGVGLRNRNRADRRRPEVPVGHVLPVCPAVRRLPHAARARPEVEDPALHGMPCHRHHTTAPEGPNTPPVQSFETTGLQVSSRYVVSAHVFTRTGSLSRDTPMYNAMPPQPGKSIHAPAAGCEIEYGYESISRGSPESA